MTSSRRLLDTSVLICDAIATIQRNQADYLLVPTTAVDTESLAFITKMAEFLKANEPKYGITGAAEGLLRKILSPSYFTTPNYTYLITEIGVLWHQENSPLDSHLAPIAALLLDADNQTLDREKEQWLQEVTQTQINYKFAFANWKTKNSDSELVKRGYELIHAPAGNDVADGLLIAFSGTIHKHYSDVNRVFICSNDNTFNALVNPFQRYGITCYRVLQQNKHRISVHNFQTGESQDYRPPLPSKHDFIDQVSALIKDLQKFDQPWIPLRALEEAYRDKYGVDSQDVVKSYNEEHKTMLAFLKSEPRFFATHTVQSRQYVCRFLTRPIIASVKEALPKEKNTLEAPALEMVRIIINLMQAAGKKLGEFSIPSVITTNYNINYNQGILTGLQQRGLISNLRVFLSKYPRYFEIKKTGEDGQWEVAYIVELPPITAEEPLVPPMVLPSAPVS